MHVSSRSKHLQAFVRTLRASELNVRVLKFTRCSDPWSSLDFAVRVTAAAKVIFAAVWDVTSVSKTHNQS